MAKAGELPVLGHLPLPQRPGPRMRGFADRYLIPNAGVVEHRTTCRIAEIATMLVMPAYPLRPSLNTIAMYQAVYFTAAQALGVSYSHQSQKYHVDRPKATS